MPIRNTNLSVEAQTALSYLDDIEKARHRLDPDENYIICERRGQEILRGDMTLARNEANRSLNELEVPMLHAMCHFEEGMIYLKIAQGFGKYADVDPANRRKKDLYMAKAGEAFQHAIDCDPEQVYYYNLGVVCTVMNRKQEAVRMFQKAQEGDDVELATNARKEIGRLGPVQFASPSPSPYLGETSAGTNGPQAEVRFERRQTVDVRTIVWGAVITLVGIPLIGVLIGLLMVPAGIVMMIKGALTKVDV